MKLGDFSARIVEYFEQVDWDQLEDRFVVTVMAIGLAYLLALLLRACATPHGGSL